MAAIPFAKYPFELVYDQPGGTGLAEPSTTDLTILGIATGHLVLPTNGGRQPTLILSLLVEETMTKC